MRLPATLTAVLIGLFALVACGGSEPLTIWFIDGTGTMVSEERDADIGVDDTSLERALAELVAGPDNTDLVSGLPSETEFAVDVEDGIAILDVGAGFSSGLSVAGSAATVQSIAPVVWTATEIEGVTAVLLREAGEPLELQGSGLVFDDPLTRDDFPGAE